MNLAHLIERAARKTLGEANERRPKAPVNVGDSTAGERAYEHGGGVVDLLQKVENLMALRMGPPTAFDWLSGNPGCE